MVADGIRRGPFDPIDRPPEPAGVAGIKILVIEDDNALGIALWHSLERAGFDASLVQNIDECKAAVREMSPSIVILDLLQERDWVRQCKSAMPRGRRPVPLLILSAYPVGDKERRAIHTGANAFLVKPVDLAPLYGFVYALLLRSGAIATDGMVDPLKVLFEDVEGRYRGQLEDLAASHGFVLGRGAREIAADALLAFWHMLPEFTEYENGSGVFRLGPPDSEIMGWFGKTVANICKARHRAVERHEKKMEKVAAHMAHQIAGGSRLSVTERMERRDELEWLFRRSPARDRAIVFHRHYDDMDYVDIARIYGLTEGAVRNIVSAAVQLARETGGE